LNNTRGLDDLAASAVSQVLQAPDVLGTVIERADRRTHSYEHLQRLQAEWQRAKREGGVLSNKRKPEQE
jgi:hypothetical protein